MNILEEIFRKKSIDLTRQKEIVPVSLLEAQLPNLPKPISFRAALEENNRTRPRLIAEIKRQSPSKGVLITGADPLNLAQIYQENGAAAISILTEENYFAGSLSDLARVAGLGLGLPLLRKDFIFDRYQLIEARVSGASAVLLITAMLSIQDLKDLIRESRNLDLSPLVEIHDEADLEAAVAAGATVIGINNRNLRDFSVDLNTSLHLKSRLPHHYLAISESGIKNQKDVDELAGAGFDAILVGETLMVSEDVAATTRALSGITQQTTTRAAL